MTAADREADAARQEEYETFAHPYHQRVFSQFGDRAPTILFAKEHPAVELMVASGADVVSVGQCVNLTEAKARFGGKVAFQGNVDNAILLGGSFDEIDAAVRKCVTEGGHQGHILNLNHGVLPQTPLENVLRLVETCRSITSQPEA